MIGIAGGGALAAGLTLGAASMLSIGPNNLMLVREGLRGGRVGLVATVVWINYLVLIVMAFCLTDTIALALAPLKAVLLWLGLAAVAWFATQSLRAALRAEARRDPAAIGQESRSACICRVAAVVWLNPLSYVERLLIPAALCGSFKDPMLRIEFVFGLMIMTTVNCYGYSLASEYCSSFLRHRRTLQVFDATSGLLLSGIAIAMGVALVHQTI